MKLILTIGICGILGSGLMLAFFALWPTLPDTGVIFSSEHHPGPELVPVTFEKRTDIPAPLPTPVPYELLRKQYNPREMADWKSMKIEDYGIADIKLPPDFEDYYFSWTTLHTIILELGKDPGGPTSDFLINITESVKNPRLSPQRDLEKALEHHKNKSQAIEHNSVRIHYINHIKGILTQRGYDTGKVWLEWVTFRYFKGEMQRIRIEVNISDGKFQTLAPVMNSVRFAEKSGEYLKQN